MLNLEEDLYGKLGRMFKAFDIKDRIDVVLSRISAFSYVPFHFSNQRLTRMVRIWVESFLAIRRFLPNLYVYTSKKSRISSNRKTERRL